VSLLDEEVQEHSANLITSKHNFQCGFQHGLKDHSSTEKVGTESLILAVGSANPLESEILSNHPIQLSFHALLRLS
jgi:hypothetical protein